MEADRVGTLTLLRQKVKTAVWGMAYLLASVAGNAQVLARPGWAGSGVAPEAWWPRAVFYRVDPARFQDSDGDGRGDLPGVIQRLDYLQSLGVDAVLLDSTVGPGEMEALGDLVREASRRHLRVLVTVRGELQAGPRTALLQDLHDWLATGVAGVWVPRPPGVPRDDPAYPALLSAVGSVVGSFPGARVLLTDAATEPVRLGPRPVRLPRRGGPPASRGGTGATLVSVVALPSATGNGAQLREALLAASEGADQAANPLLRTAADSPTGSTRSLATATMLLASRGAVVLDFGSEIGLDTYPVAAAGAASGALGAPLMQWTPSNRTPAAASGELAGAPGAGAQETVFGAYHPYQPPPRGLTTGMPAPARVSRDLDAPEPLPAPDTLPGFTGGELPAAPVRVAELNVITQDRDPRSLLNAYRQLIALHHDNATVRQGTEYVLPSPAEEVLVWVRRAPAGSRTVANVLAAVNLSDTPATLDVDGELGALGMRPGALRPLFSPAAAGVATGQTTTHAVLPPHGALVAEIYHGGVIAPEPEGERSGRRGRASGRRGRARVRG